MARINQQLLDRLQNKLRLSQSRVYGLIDAKVRSAHLPRDLAAIAVAAERGVSISKFASAEDLAAIRQSAMSAAPAPVVVQQSTPPSRRNSKVAVKAKRPTTAQRRRGTTVFVVHGR